MHACVCVRVLVFGAAAVGNGSCRDDPFALFEVYCGAPDSEDLRPSVRKMRQTARVECARIFDTAGRQRENGRDNPGASTILQDSVLIIMLVLQRRVLMRELLMHVKSLSGNDTSRNNTRVP